MATTANQDGSEDVQDFLQRIRELGDKRDREDEERTRKLEEEILQGRKERQARRAERARSLSPTKDSPSTTPQSVRATGTESPRRDAPAQSPLDLSSSRPGTSQDSFAKDSVNRVAGEPSPSNRSGALHFGSKTRNTPEGAAENGAMPRQSPSAAMSPSRDSPLSWQRRPDPQVSPGSRSRHVPALASNGSGATDRGSPALSEVSPLTPGSPSDVDPSRHQIAQSLASKDPAWFKQTQDRGASSAAYRRNQSEMESDNALGNERTRLPGMARDAAVAPKPQWSPPLASALSPSPSREGSVRAKPSLAQQISNAALSSDGGSDDIKPPLSMTDSQRLNPASAPMSPDENQSRRAESGRTIAMSPSQGRISPERAASPTKGLGGFVQSAMMKRSDSVNKRWSAQLNPGLNRVDSFTSSRAGQGGSNRSLAGLASPPSPTKHEFRPSDLSRENSAVLEARPGSDRSDATVTRDAKENERPHTPDTSGHRASDGFVRPALPNHSRPQSFVGEDRTEDGVAKIKATPPTSPSKTMDQKRWSPTKSSWLETALNKGPESPPKQKPAAAQAPGWMSEINKAKRQRENAEAERGLAFKEVNTGGLLRAPPLGGPAQPFSIGGLPNGFSSGTVKKGPAQSDANQDGAAKPASPPIKPKPFGSPSLSNAADSPNASAEQSTNAESAAAGGTLAKSSSSHQGQSPAGTKLKAEAPPNDFRSTLKSRQGAGDGKNNDEPEFKNVFGKLKRTTTQNYVAPDELKNNILRGKAGLNATGGPKKTERRDDFKESLLKQKEAMKLKAQQEAVEPRSRSGSSTSAGKGPESTPPEAILRKKSLARSDNAVGEEMSQGTDVPEALAKQQRLKEASRPTGPDSVATSPPQKESVASGKLASRFNPALAGLLARGPPSASSTAGTDRAASGASASTSQRSRESSGDGTSTGQLTHVTKARARGPKRRPPPSKDQEATPVQEPTSKLEAATSSPVRDPSTASQSSTRTDATGSLGTSVLVTTTGDNEPIEEPKQTSASTDANPTQKPLSPVSPTSKPSSPAKSSFLGRESPASFKGAGLAHAKTNKLGGPRPPPFKSPKASSPTKSFTPTPDNNSKEQEKENLAVVTDFQSRVEDDRPAVSVREAAATLRQSTEIAWSQNQPVKSPIKLPTREDERVAMEEAGLMSPLRQESHPASAHSSPVNVGSATSPRHLSSPVPKPPPKSPARSMKSPVLDTNKPLPILKDHTSVKSSMSPTKAFGGAHETEGHRLLAQFFGQEHKASARVDIDTQAILSARPAEPGRIKTISKQIWQVTGDGKRLAVPAHQEHILFEDDLYLCTHMFDSSNGSRTSEVYLWAGDNVSDSAVEDAQLFSRKVAKENNGRLISIRQGREPANLFQALGGILITRRGSASRADSSSPYVLCCRQHLGQIAFDQVELSVDSLCSAYPYLVSTTSGKVFLWRGKGSGIDELSSARLIGMDLGASGGIEEVEEGKEPAAFFHSFGVGPEQVAPKSAEHWKLKPNCAKYMTRLFCVHHGTRGKILEISPFSQADLDREHIYVVDAFFEMYIILGAQAQSKSAEFQSALMFAQEYGILAASLEDRPVIPNSVVVLQGMPQDLKAVFRKWEDRKMVTARDGRQWSAVQTIPLNVAIEAMRS